MTKNNASITLAITRTVIILLVGFAIISPLHAHELRPTVVDIAITGATASDERRALVSVRANLEKLIAEIAPDHDDTESSPNRALYDVLRAMDADQLAAEYMGFERTVIDAIDIQSGVGRPIELRKLNVSIPPTGDVAIARDSMLTFELGLQPDDRKFSWLWDKKFGEIIVRADYDNEQDPYSALLAGGQRSSAIELGSSTTVSILETVQSYVVVGFQHIIPLGLDHILFVVGIFLLSAKFKPLLLQVTVFTIAHTITLMLGTLDIIRLPGSVVEPLIAASIVFVCVENLFRQSASRWRLLLVFVFGLLHGLGFASVLGDFGISATHFVAALLAFNIGVELGQLSVIAVCFLLLGVWAKQSWYNAYIRIPASCIIGGIGLFWFVERVLGN